MVNPFKRFAQAAFSWAAKRGWSIANDETAKILGLFRPTLSGVSVTDDSLLESPEFFAGVRNIAEDLATLPLFVYKRITERRKEVDTKHPLFEILHDAPNEEMDAVQFIESQQAHLMIRRNCYSEVVRNGRGEVTALWPIHPKFVQIIRIDGELVYRVNLPQGQLDRRTDLPFTVLRRDQMLHIKAFALDGIQGMPVSKMHSEAVGLSIALDRYGAAFFGNSASPEGVYTTPNQLTDVEYSRLKEQLKSRHGGIDQAHQLMLLENGTTFSAVSVDPQKAQAVESKKYATTQMARLNRIAPHKIGDLSQATFSNIEHQGIDYVVSSIRPPAVRWERAIRMQLLLKDERRTHFAEFLLEGLLRGDVQARNAALQIERQNGIINANEWRELDNRNPIAGGEIYMVNSAMVPLDEAGRPQLASKPGQAPDPVRVFLPLFRVAAERCIRKEAAAIRKAAERNASLPAFDRSVTEFYGTYDATVRQAFVPVVIAVAEALRGEVGPDISDWAHEFASRITVSRSAAAREELRATAGSSNLTGAVVAITDKWAKDEPSALATRELENLVSSLKKQLKTRALEAAA